MTTQQLADALPAASVVVARVPLRRTRRRPLRRPAGPGARRRRERLVTDLLVAGGIPSSREARSWSRQVLAVAARTASADAASAVRAVRPARPLDADPRALDAVRDAVLERARRATAG